MAEPWWVPVAPSHNDGCDVQLIGEREGHSATALQTRGGVWWALVFGGFVEGSSSSLILGAELTPLSAPDNSVSATLAWRVVGDSAEVANREAFGLVQRPQHPATAVVLMGMSSEYELLDDVWCVTLLDGEVERDVEADGQLVDDVHVQVHPVTCLGDKPAARYRHSVSVTPEDNTIWVFGGETEHGATNELFQLSTVTWCWRKVATPASTDVAPVPRGLSYFGVRKATDGTNSAVCFVAGGMWYPAEGSQASFGDGWVGTVNLDTPEVQWLPLETPVLLAPANGGVTLRLRCGAWLIACGKDTAVGRDEVHVVTGLDEANPTSLQVRRFYPPSEFDDVEHEDGVSRGYPHWRYLPAGVSWPLHDGRSAVLVIAGQCRHPDPVTCYLLRV